MTSKIWYEDIANFLTPNNYYLILPIQQFTFEEKPNALLRFFIYLGIALALLTFDSRYLFFSIIAAIATVLLYEGYKSNRTRDETFLLEKGLSKVDGEACVRSTVDNPFMNPMWGDAADRPAACNVLDKRVQTKIEENFNARLFRDVGDIWGRMSSQREFYTMPSTTVPNNAIAFAEWCYGASFRPSAQKLHQNT